MVFINAEKSPSKNYVKWNGQKLDDLWRLKFSIRRVPKEYIKKTLIFIRVQLFLIKQICLLAKCLVLSLIVLILGISLDPKVIY